PLPARGAPAEERAMNDLWPDDYEGRVFVYFDLHHRCWSVRSCKTGRVLNMEDAADGKRRKVVVHRLCLRDCVFTVQPRARQQALKSGGRTGHAGVYGYLARPEPEQLAGLTRRVTYRPFERGEFFDVATGEAITTAPLALFESGRVFVAPPAGA